MLCYADEDGEGEESEVEHDDVCAKQHVAEDDAGEALGRLLNAGLLDCFDVPADIMLHYFIAGKKTRCYTIS